MSQDDDEPFDQAASEKQTGYKLPPAGSRFKKGQSGNPGGRRRNQFRQPPYEAVLGQLVTIREGGIERKVIAAEAFLQKLAKQGLEGDTAAARATASAIEESRLNRAAVEARPPSIIVHGVAPGSVSRALEALHMAKKLDPFRETARMALEPWLVEQALARLGDKRLTLGEQKIVVKATRTPRQVKWPDWWSFSN